MILHSGCQYRRRPRPTGVESLLSNVLNVMRPATWHIRQRDGGFMNEWANCIWIIQRVIYYPLHAVFMPLQTDRIPMVMADHCCVEGKSFLHQAPKRHPVHVSICPVSFGPRGENLCQSRVNQNPPTFHLDSTGSQ